MAWSLPSAASHDRDLDSKWSWGSMIYLNPTARLAIDAVSTTVCRHLDRICPLRLFGWKNTLSEDTSELMPFTFAGPEYFIGIVIIGYLFFVFCIYAPSHELFIIYVIYSRAVTWTARIVILHCIVVCWGIMWESSYSQLISCVCLSTDLLYLRVIFVSYCLSFENRI